MMNQIAKQQKASTSYNVYALPNPGASRRIRTPNGAAVLGEGKEDLGKAKEKIIDNAPLCTPVKVSGTRGRAAVMYLDILGMMY